MNILKTLNEAAGIAINEFKSALTGDGKPLSYHDEGFTAAGLAQGNDISRDQRIADQMSAEYHARKAAQPGQV